MRISSPVGKLSCGLELQPLTSQTQPVLPSVAANMPVFEMKLGTYQGHHSFTLAYYLSFQNPDIFECVWPPLERESSNNNILASNSSEYGFFEGCF